MTFRKLGTIFYQKDYIPVSKLGPDHIKKYVKLIWKKKKKVEHQYAICVRFYFSLKVHCGG